MENHHWLLLAPSLLLLVVARQPVSFNYSMGQSTAKGLSMVVALCTAQLSSWLLPAQCSAHLQTDQHHRYILTLMIHAHHSFQFTTPNHHASQDVDQLTCNKAGRFNQTGSKQYFIHLNVPTQIPTTYNDTPSGMNDKVLHKFHIYTNKKNWMQILRRLEIAYHL